MRKITSMLTAIAFVGTAVFVASCDKSEDPPLPKPTLTASSSSMSIMTNKDASVNVDISAAAGIKDVTATLDKSELGTVEITNKADLTGNVGTATVKFTSAEVLGSGTITVTVTDNSSQTASTTLAVTVTETPPVEVAGEMGDTGTKETHITTATTWGPHLTYHVTSNVFVEKTGSLTLLEGTTVIVDGELSFTVRGNFYSYGTATDSVLFTVPENKRTKENIFEGLWGGVLSSNTDGTNEFAADEMVVQYTRMEYAGMLVQSWQDIYKIAEVADGDPEYALFFNNIDGVCVIQNSTFAYTRDVAVQVDQGKILITNNAFVLNGVNGGESIDTKVGTNGDIAYNLFYKPATNGVKFNAKNGSAELHIYNNTVIEGGWRQSDHPGHGGSFNAEQGAKGLLYNNLIVNSTRGTRFSTGKLPDVAHLSVGYNFHYIPFYAPVVPEGEAYYPQFYPEDGFIIRGNNGGSPVDPLFETANDIPAPVFTEDVYDEEATVGNSVDPMFENYDAASFDADAAETAEDPTSEDFPATFDFHLKSGSPALTGGKTGFSPYNTAALTVGGKTYQVPQPSAYFGAFGKK